MNIAVADPSVIERCPGQPCILVVDERINPCFFTFLIPPMSSSVPQDITCFESAIPIQQPL